ncbi:thioredoxin family protein [Polymorphobacter multimanifer]|uniref:Peroxiredoxin n=1 Tax=Polymorphobacter multimanifer TaxID=1070431 RepID=A0A841L9U8_9SPHN|nr:redoxin domain-containing protein [Polymorphobacter multimanifer]MBB6227743.1 peroxiredoxin [Polymorphobacter multimanifer]GGI90099.1 thioredoxin family protein [Polymorphobacter multimanifer]
MNPLLPFALIASGFAMSSVASAAPVVGQPAPAFTALDANGKPVSLTDFKGKTVVLEWTNPGCPFVRGHYDSGNMQATQAKAKAEGAVWLTINSGAPGKQGHMTGTQARAQLATDKSAPAHYLLDPRGTVGTLYAAKTTPHIYVITPEGRLAYNGAINDRPTAEKDDALAGTNYALAALTAVKAGKAPSPAVTKPYGCSVKYPG